MVLPNNAHICSGISPSVAGHYYCCFNSIIPNLFVFSMKKDRVVDLSMSELNLDKDTEREIVGGMWKKSG